MRSKSWLVPVVVSEERPTLHHGNSALLKARSQALYQEDEHKPLRKSHENPDIIKLYEEYLGKPVERKSPSFITYPLF